MDRPIDITIYTAANVNKNQCIECDLCKDYDWIPLLALSPSQLDCGECILSEKLSYNSDTTCV